MIVDDFERGFMKTEHKNYLSIAQPSFWYRHFCYIDRKEYYADDLFIKHKLRVWFYKEMHRQDTGYVIIFCKIRKCDETLFLKAMEELNNKMILLGHTDYSDFCEHILEHKF